MNTTPTKKVISLEAGFTMIELLMVIMIVSMLGATALPQFLDLRKEARIAAVQNYVSSVRAGIKNQKAQMILRCNAAIDDILSINHIMANDITVEPFASAEDCATTEVDNPDERRFVDSPVMLTLASLLGEAENSHGTISVPSLGPARISGSCAQAFFDLYGTASIWCYDEQTGDFWADSLSHPELVNF